MIWPESIPTPFVPHMERQILALCQVDAQTTSLGMGFCILDSFVSVRDKTTPSAACCTSDFEQAPSHRNRDSMSSVVRLKFLNQVFDMEIDRRLGDSELLGNLFVSMAIPNELQHLQFAGSKVVFAIVL